MASVLLERVEQVESSARRLIYLVGLARFGTCTVAATVAIGLLDYSFRPSDPLSRWILFSLYWGLIVASFRKFLWPAIRAPRDPVATARQIELRLPKLRDRLSSAVSFARQMTSDPVAGSLDLRQAAITQTEAVAAALNFHSVLNHRMPSRILMMAMFALACAGVVMACNPAAASLALLHLAAPWQAAPWPTRHQLAFVNPRSVLAAGDDFEVIVVDHRGPLPDEVRIDIRRQTASGLSTETKIITPLAAQAVFRLENVAHSFEFRARGGDDDTMPWLPVTVVQPPTISELDVLVRPPLYTGLPPKSESHSVTAFVGSLIDVRGKVDQPVRDVALKTEAAESKMPDVELAGDHIHFSAPATGSSWAVDGSQTFYFELTDQHGLTFRTRGTIDLHAVEDKPPGITWETPAEHISVVAGAQIPIQCTVTDDLAVRSAKLHYSCPEIGDDEKVVTLFERDVSPSVASSSSATSRLDCQRLDFTLDLAGLTALAPGDVIQVHLTADDFKPQLTTTAIRRITIISSQDFAARIAARQSAIISQLGQALQAARQAATETQNLQKRINPSEQITAPDVAALDSIQYRLLQVARQLDAGSEGAVGQTTTLREELATNRAIRGGPGERLNALLEQIRDITTRQLPAIDAELTESLRLARDAIQRSVQQAADASASSPTTAIGARLENARQREDELIESLQRMVASVSRSDKLTRVARDLAHIKGAEQQLAAATDGLGLKSIGGIGDLAPADRSEGQKLRGQQLELARQFDKLQTDMQQSMAAVKDEPSPATDALASAIASARRLAIGSRMREAASQLAQHRFASAREAQQHVLDAVDELLTFFSLQEDAGSGRDSQNAGEDRKQRSGNTGDTNRSVAQSSGGTATEPTNAATSKNSEDGTQKADGQPNQSTDTSAILNRIWGHLPEKTREQLQASRSDQFLPKYERLIEEFYQRLAEERSTAP